MLTATDIAAPSCVLPAPVADNALFLAGRVGEVGLCFFETKACLGYTDADIPPTLAALPLRWHVHLPVDLPWVAGGAAASHAAQAVLAKAEFLQPRYAVLHAPEVDLPLQNKLLQEFITTWGASCPILLENTQHCNFCVLSTDIVHKCALCLDVGHLLAFGQQGILQSQELMNRVRLVHWSAPGDGDRHLPLTALTAAQRALVREIVQKLPRNVRHMLEVFAWDGVAASVPVLAQILEE